MEFVPKEEALVIGKGSKTESGFMVLFYNLADNRLLFLENFTDSALNVLNGQHIAYHANRKKFESVYYKNNLLHGTSIKWDSLGNMTDSAIYYEGMPTYLVKYQLNSDGSKQKLHEFDNDYPKRRLTEQDIIITDNGAVVTPAVWQSLVYNGAIHSGRIK
ncbi:toxin-antitoxin system YwqK family antitoxin [Niabella hibiscisoli]|uniref:hypothetical protein n=1 Tax=Niabella hibiscisoli TaxID=1825928 RepID=UPI001F0FB491|nr:hypothetical protein [Niabella hibiscisoli]MCH5715652.1 hypothetical protein [Niabella hibiscisoli]